MIHVFGKMQGFKEVVIDGTVPSNKKLSDGTVPSNKKLHDGTSKKGGSGEGCQREVVGRGGSRRVGAVEGLLALGLGATIEKERVAPRGGLGRRPDRRPAPLRPGRP
jgi:hypothetical protein